MRITVAVHGHLQSISSVGQDEVVMTLPDSGALRVRDLLEALNLIEEEIGQVTYNGRRVRLDTNVRHRAKLDFFSRETRIQGHHQPDT